MMSLHEAARRLGGDGAGRTVTCPGPGHSPRDRSLSVTFDINGDFIVYSHAGDDWQACRDHVRQLLGFGTWQPPLRDDRRIRPLPTADEEGRIRTALAIWRETREARGTLAETYLASRKLKLDDRACEALRFHPALRFEGRTAPGMVALLRDLRSDESCGIHRTFLDHEGRKLDRRMLGRAKGAAVKLDPDDEVTLGLVVGEGVETCLAARMLGFRPTWALGSASAIEHLPALAGIEGLTILGEADDGGANARAAKACARRWIAAGADVSVLEPFGGGDANDVLREAMA